MYKSVLSVFRKLIAYVILVGVFVGGALLLHTPVHATAGINQQVNFQGRLLNAQGATVPDGYYNIQFKIYQDGDGLSVGDTTGAPVGSLKWTESYVDNNSNQGVLVKNGFMSVQLGSIVPFGVSVNWNQDTLWLSMNIAGSNNTCTTFNTGSCIADGEMVPMKRLSSSTYSLNSGQLGGLTAGQFIQNTTTLQTANIAVQSSNSTNIAALIQGAASQSADIFQVKATGITTPLLAVSSAGKFSLQPVADSTEIFSVKTSLGNNILTIDSLNSRVGIGLGSGTAPTLASTGLEIQGALRLSGGGVYTDNYNTPLGTLVATKINIPSYNPGNYGQILALGLPSTSSTTSRAISIFDARTVAHQPSLAVFSPDENNILGFSWDGSNTTGYIKNTANTVAVQGGGLNLLTATNNSGNANVGIGNSATNGYALDVTGDISSSTQYRIAGVVTLTNSALTFSAASTSNIQSAAGQSLNLNGLNGISMQTNGTTRATFDTANNLYLGNGITAAAPSNFTISGTGSATTAVAGGAVTVQGGNATVGNANGGNVTLSGGNGIGTGTTGLVVLTTPTFQTSATQLCTSTPCNVTQANVDGGAAIVINTNGVGYTVNLPNLTLGTSAYGRVVYVTSASTNDFTLSVNGGGTGNTIAMRNNTTATMIWGPGSSGLGDWTAAGASSSTTLQSAYDNTLQGAGGAELVVSHTATTNGLTIRDSTASPVNGTLLSVQTASAATLLSVNGNVTEYASNAGAETAGGSPTTFPANTWSTSGTGATLSRYITAGNFINTGQGSVLVQTSANANSGALNILSTQLTAGQHYNVSFAARLDNTSATFATMNVWYSVNGTTQSVQCGIANQTVPTSVWTKINCSFVAPASGITATNAILIQQSDAVAHKFYIDNLSVTIAADLNYTTDGGVDNTANFATNWPVVGAATVTQDMGVGNDTSDSAKVVSASANTGVKNKLSVFPLTSTLYRVTAYVAATASFNTFKIQYTYNNGTMTDCLDYKYTPTTTISTTLTAFTKVTCYITTPTAAATNPYVLFTQTDAVAHTWYVDTISMTLASNSTPNVQVGGGVNGGPTTLFTLDRGASAPIANNNDALLGSMYYDTTIGKLQCYESDGWGACGSSPDNVVTIAPEYTNAVLHGTGIGTMTSDLCSGTLAINDGSSSQPTICSSTETYNFYKWTSPQASDQYYSIYVTYQLPATFKAFTSGSTSLQARVDSLTSAGVQLQIYKNHSGLTTCGGNIMITTTANTWQYPAASGTADPSTCSFAGGDSIVFKITAHANSNANAYIGNLNFIFSNR